MEEYDVIVKNIFGKLSDDTSILIGVSADETQQDCVQLKILLG